MHCAFIGAIGLARIALHSATPLYEEYKPERDHAILYYRPPKRLPDVSPTSPKGASISRGADVSKQTIIATSAKAKSEKQFIWMPAPQIELRQDLPAPNLIIRAAAAILPPPPKEAPPPPKQPKTFQPPPRAVQEAKPPQATIPEPAPPTISSQVGPRLAMRNGVAILAPPPPPEPPSLDSTSNGNVNIAVANLNIVEKSLPELPDGARPAQFSKAPVKGPASPGFDNDPSILKVPDLTVRGADREDSAKTPEEKRGTRIVVYAERVRNLPTASLSVPLRPATRMIPPGVDLRFRGRNVYAIVIPIENMPAYGGDWIVWFSEKDARPGETPLVRAPVPFRKVEAADPPPTNRTPQRVQVAGILEKSGKLGTVSVVTAAISGLAEAVIQDVTSWQFKPATRNGSPIDVDVVIEIPFNTPSNAGATATP